EGSVKVWDDNEKVPEKGDDDGLDPDYVADTFEKSYACTNDMVFPVSYRCELEPTLAQGAARLTIKALGALVSAINADEVCGFASQSSLDSSVWRGTIGDDGGEVSFGTGSSCTLDFSEPYPLSTD